MKLVSSIVASRCESFLALIFLFYFIFVFIFFAGEELCCQDTFPNFRNSWAKAFKKHVGRVSLELCISYIRSGFSHGKLKLLLVDI